MIDSPKPGLGRLERVNLRDAWFGEATDFTPWLAQPENMALLGEAIGIELEVESQEANVGPFRADILCRDTINGHYVLIENQLERTDHTHLGQLLTYAAGLDAASIVWVAARFTEEHRAALDWLNNATSSGFNFFGLEIELWRIGGSAMAPKFNVISKPNDWSKAVREQAAGAQSGELTEFQRLHLEFWTQFRQYLEDRGSSIHSGRPSKDHWTNVAVGRTNFGLSAGIATTSLKHATHFKRYSQAGMVMVNLPTAGVDYHVPFGGRKGSSYGPREQGRYAQEFFTIVKTAYTDPN